MIGKGMVLHATCALAPLLAKNTALFCHLLSCYGVWRHGSSQAPWPSRVTPTYPPACLHLRPSACTSACAYCSQFRSLPVLACRAMAERRSASGRAHLASGAQDRRRLSLADNGGHCLSWSGRRDSLSSTFSLGSGYRRCATPWGDYGCDRPAPPVTHSVRDVRQALATSVTLLPRDHPQQRHESIRSSLKVVNCSSPLSHQGRYRIPSFSCESSCNRFEEGGQPGPYSRRSVSGPA